MSEKPATAAHLAALGAFDNPESQVDHGTQPSGSLTSDTVSPAESFPEVEQPAAKGWRFWAVFPPLCLATLLVALESTITSTALPVITAALDSGDNYVWFLNGYLLTS